MQGNNVDNRDIVNDDSSYGDQEFFWPVLTQPCWALYGFPFCFSAASLRWSAFMNESVAEKPD